MMGRWGDDGTWMLYVDTVNYVKMISCTSDPNWQVRLLLIAQEWAEGTCVHTAAGNS